MGRLESPHRPSVAQQRIELSPGVADALFDALCAPHVVARVYLACRSFLRCSTCGAVVERFTEDEHTAVCPVAAAVEIWRSESARAFQRTVVRAMESGRREGEQLDALLASSSGSH